ncbi:MAG TPA: acyl-CoA dehydrogenase family protein [Xanthobacteraceae bacterium]|jgi:alkylation response protein AidB-like acyl-CoA dehydrogenase|nr:acyl-CoA dehydrogenase family protein [Xanthobacteraceae bacterium]
MDERTTVDCVANARALAPVLVAAGPRIDAGRELPPDVVDALHEARMFRMLVPRSLGGEEASPLIFVQAIEELAKADASAAWCIAQTSVCSTISKSMPRQTAEEIFRRNPRGVLAWGASTHNDAKAIAVAGGFRVTGVWPFASGSRHATWLAAHCFIVEPDGEPRRDAGGKPVQKTLVVPREQADIRDVWQVIGLKGTGSDSYALNDVFVPAHCAIDYHAMDLAEWHEHGPLYTFNIYQLFGSTFPAIALGIARATLDAFVELARSKVAGSGSAPLRENAVVQSQVGIAQCQLAAARSFYLSAWEDIWQAAQAGTVSMDQRVRLRMASIHASQQARQVVETAYLAAGATAVFASNPFERRFRDMHAVSQQAQSQFSIFEAIGRYFLGLGPHPRLF